MTRDWLHMIARIIPAIRAPRRLAAFDYEIPEALTITRGDLVRIPFRTSKIIGLVLSIDDRQPSEEMPLKPILGSYASLRFRTETIDLLARLASRAFVSEASVLHAWIGSCPKRPKENALRPSIRLNAGRTERYRLNHIVGPEGVIASAKSLTTFGTKALIITPWAARAERLASKLNARCLTSIMPMGARYASWSAFIRGDATCLVTTRIGAWLSLEADAVIVDEPENDDHKQDELSPRYDARWIAEFAAQHRTVSFIGLTPRLRNLSASPVDALPELTPDLTTIDIYGKDWSPVSGIQNRTLTLIEEAAREERPITIIHPIHGDRARLRCADCSWEAVCPACGASLRLEAGRSICTRCKRKTDTTAVCTLCGSANLSNSRPGRERLDRDLRSRLNSTNFRIVSIGEWNAIDDVPPRSLIVCTDLALLSGGVEDLRRKERLTIAVRRLADRTIASSSTLCVQADYALLAEAKRWLTPDGLKEAMSREYAERQAFRLPPASRLVKIIFRGNEQAVRVIFERLIERISQRPDFTINGLFMVAFRSVHDPRWVAQLTAPLETPDADIANALTPAIESDAIIDLDPVAFFE